MKSLPVIAASLSGLFAPPPGLHAQETLGIRPAVELRLPASSPFREFQIESSADMKTWTGLGPLAAGGGTELSLFVPVDSAGRFFRATGHEIVNLQPALESIRAAHGIPAMGCAVVLGGRIAGIGVTGVRKSGVPNSAVTLGDRWHHGSVTKGMTATLAAIMVQSGEIRWGSTLAEVFPALAPGMHAQWRGATLEQLTSNRGGAPEDLAPGGIWAQVQAFGGMPRDARRLLLERLAATAPDSPPGTRYEYSNAGFSLAGHMLEETAGKPWEELITERLFKPLGMTSAGFGVPATPRSIDEPWGHRFANGSPSPVESGPAADNPPAIGPSATVHCSLPDLARYVAFHLAGHRSGTALLDRDAFLKLHTPYPDNADYAHGWSALDRPWGGGEKVLTHSGSNTLWLTTVWLAPGRDFGVIPLCNMAGSPNPSAGANNEAVSRMIKDFLE
ncbi:MAG: D-alanyl-D-alanine carboxypeptidase precursor [Verrucomicrobiales bacterium]|nr:D-alanyl-D-alanine carboxypeptidase precursor [Verrucomicrobiales bacterium]